MDEIIVNASARTEAENLISLSQDYLEYSNTLRTIRNELSSSWEGDTTDIEAILVNLDSSTKYLDEKLSPALNKLGVSVVALLDATDKSAANTVDNYGSTTGVTPVNTTGNVAIGATVGGVLGGFVAGPAGAMAGAALGGFVADKGSSTTVNGETNWDKSNREFGENIATDWNNLTAKTSTYYSNTASSKGAAEFAINAISDTIGAGVKIVPDAAAFIGNAAIDTIDWVGDQVLGNTVIGNIWDGLTNG